jgi:hypothetical protein
MKNYVPTWDDRAGEVNLRGRQGTTSTHDSTTGRTT